MVVKAMKLVFALLCLGSLVGFIWVTDMSLVISQIQGIGIGFLGLIILSAMAHFCATIAWKVCFNYSSEIPLFPLFIIRVVGENITLFNPTNLVAGEASKYHLLKRLEVEKRECVNSILFSRIILILSNLLLILFCVLWILVEFNFAWVFLKISCLIPLVIFTVGFIVKRLKRNKKNWKGRSQRFRILRGATYPCSKRH